MKKVLFFLADSGVRFFAGIITFSIFFNNSGYGPQSSGLLLFALVILSVVSAILENLISLVLKLLFKKKSYEILIIFVVTLLFFLFNSYLLLCLNKSKSKVLEFVFVNFLMIMGVAVRVLLVTINSYNDNRNIKE